MGQTGHDKPWSWVPSYCSCLCWSMCLTLNSSLLKPIRRKKLRMKPRTMVVLTMVMEDGNLKPRKLMVAGVPGEVVVKPVVAKDIEAKDIEREVVLTQNHLPIQKELYVMDIH